MKQKAEIIFEIEETIIMRQGGDEFQAFCPQCQALVEMITPQMAAVLLDQSERQIFRSIESGRIHFIETERVFVCRDSLAAGSELFGLAKGAS